MAVEADRKVPLPMKTAIREGCADRGGDGEGWVTVGHRLFVFNDIWDHPLVAVWRSKLTGRSLCR